MYVCRSDGKGQYPIALSVNNQPPGEIVLGTTSRSMSKSKNTLSAILCLLILCTTAFSATYYVSPLGSDSNAGSLENKPFRVVQRAIDQMKTGTHWSY